MPRNITELTRLGEIADLESREKGDDKTCKSRTTSRGRCAKAPGIHALHVVIARLLRFSLLIFFREHWSIENVKCEWG